MQTSQTVFGSLEHFQKGGVQVIDDSAKDYAFSNVFDVASKSRPYEKVAVAKNLKYVLEAVRTEGVSPWFANVHDESALVMDGEILVQFIQPTVPPAPPGTEGTLRLDHEPSGTRMGWVRAKRGHMVLLPAGAAYQFQTIGRPGVLLVQTIAGPQTVERWADICQVA
jgi:hypothetical protein